MYYSRYIYDIFFDWIDVFWMSISPCQKLYTCVCRGVDHSKNARTPCLKYANFTQNTQKFTQITQKFTQNTQKFTQNTRSLRNIRRVDNSKIFEPLPRNTHFLLKVANFTQNTQILRKNAKFTENTQILHKNEKPCLNYEYFTHILRKIYAKNFCVHTPKC